jgi:hypothetical protein
MVERLEIYNITFQENSLSFSDIRSRYMGVNPGCGNSKFLYSLKDDSVHSVLCHSFSCERCRRIKKRLLFFRLLDVCVECDLHVHTVITCAGDDYRSVHSIEDSYSDMAKAWNKLRLMIKYHMGNDFSYVAMPRAQKNGYCHYHILSNFVLNKSWLQTVLRRYPIFGFVGLGRRRDPVRYLCNDFFKDSEYYIPFGKRHFSVSRDVHVGTGDVDEFRKMESLLFFKSRGKSSLENLDVFADAVDQRFGRPLPFEEYMKVFYTSVVK